MRSFPMLIGILNTTPDSFSDGGVFANPQKALYHAQKMIQGGADIIDIGAESTAPQNSSITANEEWERLKNIIPLLLKKNIPLSLDSYHVETWERLLETGKKMKILNQVQDDVSLIINDVSGLEIEQVQKIEFLQKHSTVKIIVMFSQKCTDQILTSENIIDEEIIFLKKIITLFQKHNISLSRLIFDTGMGGFLSKDSDVSFTLLAELSQIKNYIDQNNLKIPLYIGTSRKTFLKKLVEKNTGDISKDRLLPSIQTALQAWGNGAEYLRVHDVKETKEYFEKNRNQN